MKAKMNFMKKSRYKNSKIYNKYYNKNNLINRKINTNKVRLLKKNWDKRIKLNN